MTYLAFQGAESFPSVSSSPLICLEGDFFGFYTSHLGTEVIQVAEAFLPLLTNNFQVALGKREMVSLSKSTTHQFRLAADAAALTFNKQNHAVFRFSPQHWHPFWKRAIPTSPRATACGHPQPQPAGGVTPSSPPNPDFLAKAADLPKQLQKNWRTQTQGSFYRKAPAGLLLTDPFSNTPGASSQFSGGRAKISASSASCTLKFLIRHHSLNFIFFLSVTSIRLNIRATQSLSGFYRPFLDAS